MSRRKTIDIGTVSLPIEEYSITASAILGIRGAGKTYTAKGIAEQMLEAKIPIIAFDPIGQWHYLRRAGGGSNAKGFQVVVAGGHHPDLPLTPESAPEIVRAAIRENVPLIVDLYDRNLSKGDWRRIVRSCFRTLLYENEGVRHIFLEEAAEFAPQRVQDGETYAEVEKIVRMGGNSSLGITLINQRAQEVNKAVLDLCENLVLMRQRGAKAIEQLAKWIEHLEPDSAKSISGDLSRLEAGEAWIFDGSGDSPVRTRGRTLRSFHPDRRRPELTKSATAQVVTTDLVDRIRGELEVVIEKTKASDPAHLKRRVAELERQLQKAQKVEAPAPAELTAAHGRIAELEGYAAAVETQNTSLRSTLDAVRAALEGQSPPLPTRPAASKLRDLRQFEAAEEGRKRVQRATSTPAARANGHGGGNLKPAERKVLGVLAAYGPCDSTRLALLSGYTYSGGFRNILSALRTAGFIEGKNTEMMRITPDGEMQGPFEQLPTGEALREHWLGFGGFGTGHLKVLQALFDRPEGMTAAELCAATGYEYSGGFRNILSKLRTAGVLVGSNTDVMRPSDDLL